MLPRLGQEEVAMASPDPLDPPLETLKHGPADSPGPTVPALLIRRARDVHEPLIGKRARFLMTSHTPDGEWLAHGWKTDLRIVSEPLDDLAGLEEPGVWIQEERDYYGDYETTNRVAVELGRVWVEQYVSAPAQSDDTADLAWLDNLNRDPNNAEFRPLDPVDGRQDPVGCRVVTVGDEVETDMRAVGPVRMTNDGELAITVIAERDWYRWARDYPARPHPTLRWVPSAYVWTE